MKNLYNIYSKTGVYLCSQVASSEEQAIDFAKMYGKKHAFKAEFVRVDE